MTAGREYPIGTRRIVSAYLISVSKDAGQVEYDIRDSDIWDGRDWLEEIRDGRIVGKRAQDLRARLEASP